MKGTGNNFILVTHENFNERQYLASNPDVAQALDKGKFRSGREHFEHFGKLEGRKMRTGRFHRFLDMLNRLKQQKADLEEPHYIRSYSKFMSRLLERYSEEDAARYAVGGDFEEVGRTEYCLLRELGLKKQHTVIDVGCGSGRLAGQLVSFLEGKYIGIDIVPELIKYAENLCRRSDWSFYTAPGLQIPEPGESADVVCFFSVFTHLLHEESFQYLQEATRILKADGQIVFSFLEFALDIHWHIFEKTVNDTTPDKVLNQFISRDAIKAWAEHLGLSIQAFYDGDDEFIPIIEDGSENVLRNARFGQSVCILTKKM